MSTDPSGTAGLIYDTLSPEQREIVTADPDENLLVLAPPGTGKTHTVIARIKYLIEEVGLEPQQLLVLCFTRAAVGEIMKRIRVLIQAFQVHDDLRFVSIRTFDSYATGLLLSNNDEELILAGSGYDDRIRMAIDVLSDYESSAASIVGNCQHLIVDEIQDVVAIRAELVIAILRLAAGGFTLLGDPAQAIYGFTIPEEESGFAIRDSAGNAIGLIEWIRDQNWPGGLQIIELTHNYRSRSRIDKFGQTARQTVLGPGADEHVYNVMAQMLSVMESAGSGKEPGPELLRPHYDSVCILCRTNGELLEIASMLGRHDIPHYIRPRSTEYALPPWIGRILGPSRERRLTLHDFEQLWNQLIDNESEVSPQQAFGWLKRVEGRDRPTLDIQELQLRLYQGHRLPDEADASLSEAGRLSLSTIHAAKGREYDHVVVLTPESRRERDSRNIWREEARVLYVAATRARELLMRLERDGLHGSMWIETLSSGRRRWVTRRGAYYMEIGLPEDVDVSSFVSTYLHKHRGDAIRLQNMLWSQVRPGTVLYIHKEIRGGNAFFYVAPHRDSGLEQSDFACLSRAFKTDLGELLRKFTRSSRFTYPGYWTSVRVTRVVTEVLPPYPQNVHEPFARTGFCLGIRLRGLINISRRGDT